MKVRLECDKALFEKNGAWILLPEELREHYGKFPNPWIIGHQTVVVEFDLLGSRI